MMLRLVTVYLLVLLIHSASSGAAAPVPRVEKFNAGTCVSPSYAAKWLFKAEHTLSNSEKKIRTDCEKYLTKAVVIPTQLNTSNAGKKVEFERLFKKYGMKNLTFTAYDLQEIVSTPENVVIHKASTANSGKGGVIVEDTSLDIEGKDVGVNVRWLLDSLKNRKKGEPEPIAIWRVMTAFMVDNVVFVSTGIVKGKIVEQRGKSGFGFDPYFLPEGATKTLAEEKPDAVNARAKAIENLLNHRFSSIGQPIKEWKGKYQHD